MRKKFLIILPVLLVVILSLFIYSNYSVKSNSTTTSLGKVLGFSDLINNFLPPTEVIAPTEIKNNGVLVVPTSAFPTITNIISSPTSTYRNYSYPTISPSPQISPTQTNQNNQSGSNSKPIPQKNTQKSSELVSIQTSAIFPTTSFSQSVPTQTSNTKPLQAKLNIKVAEVNGLLTVSATVTANKLLKECLVKIYDSSGNIRTELLPAKPTLSCSDYDTIPPSGSGDPRPKVSVKITSVDNESKEYNYTEYCGKACGMKEIDITKEL